MWLGIWGPLDLHQLKEWQTLLAALIALGAATIAYRAAMAKVTLDRELATEELLRQRTGMYLRLAFALHRMKVEAEKVETKLNNSAKLKRDPITITDITVPKDIEETWKHLGLFPVPISSQLHKLRVSMEFWRNTICQDGSRVISEAPNKTLGESLRQFCAEALGACSAIDALIHTEIGDVWVEAEGGKR